MPAWRRNCTGLGRAVWLLIWWTQVSLTRCCRSSGIVGKRTWRERDASKRMRKEAGIDLEPYWISLDINSPNKPGVETIDFPMFAPHEFLAALWMYSTAVFELALFGSRGPSAVRQFWANERQHSPEFVAAHPGNREPWLWPHTGPLDTHEDEAEFVSELSASIYSCSSPLSEGSSWLTRFIMALIPDSWVIRGVTDQQIKEFQVWSFEQMLSGTWPSERYHKCSPRTSFASGTARSLGRSTRMWAMAFCILWF